MENTSSQSKTKKIAEAILGLLFLFNPRFRDWARDQTTTYLVALATALIIAIPLVIIGVFIPSKIVSSLAIAMVIIILIISWLPAGVVSHVTNSDNKIFPTTIRRMAGWLAFFGWLGIINNQWLNYWFVIILFFLFLIFTAFAPNKNSDKLVINFVTIMTVWALWVWISPNSNRAFNRYVASITNSIASTVDRGSITNESEAMVTYARPNRVLKELYLFELNNKQISSIQYRVAVNIATDSLIKVLDASEEIKPFQGQGFIQIGLPNPNGSFVDGQKFWVQADYISIISPSELASEKTRNKRNLTISLMDIEPKISKDVKVETLNYGRTVFELKAGESTPWLKFPNGCANYNISSELYRYTLEFSDGTNYNGSKNLVIPRKNDVKLRILSLEGEVITIIVS